MSSQELRHAASQVRTEPATLLAFGDSNTWGYDATTGKRLPRHRRWARVAEAMVGGSATVVEEGLNGRTCASDDPVHPGRNGLTYLGPCLESHQPLLGVTIMLGTNDLKDRFGLGLVDLAEHLSRLVDAVVSMDSEDHGSATRCLVVSPPLLQATGPYVDQFVLGIETSRLVAGTFEQVAGSKAVEFLDASRYCTTSKLDGIHLDADGHAALGAAVGRVWRTWLS